MAFFPPLSIDDVHIDPVDEKSVIRGPLMTVGSDDRQARVCDLTFWAGIACINYGHVS